ncbi:N-acetyltransferase [Ktedonosporobacter rubrisoli]|uniref:N-acetyltransferase n=1 Tax=Ktedonosporobacter rubrisoli TaxID=2509675 RepID=A0A4P6JRY0_KTERU|nr:GNAT family N-acetyltransferase [Ktedonosporobacter rubrisoli]QBD77960.1 N-acetyltransferase [Ktedonosporobacter rubrisoli]
MRIRNYRQADEPSVIQIQRVAMQEDGLAEKSVSDLQDWLANSTMDALLNTFVINDDDDELNTWGQAGTLDGLEGETVGFVTVQLYQDRRSYHFLCRGAVHPQHRRENGGRILLVGALNRARILATEFEFEAEQEGLPIYFEALLPERDPASARLAARFEMHPTEEPAPQGMRLYRRELYVEEA